ncbi:ankyrin repeat-containing domain protein [Cercophora newfieldiana]|uniref:Ankyrin repeat-containing domain protein n=1 Tax=Cercophora newfieldiana TaxID=92897 RepID=A0AA39YBV4_9PEZI|nr:ankyrin repeat-containing domain protein [Cercophora newfieldiana]
MASKPAALEGQLLAEAGLRPLDSLPNEILDNIFDHVVPTGWIVQHALFPACGHKNGLFGRKGPTIIWLLASMVAVEKGNGGGIAGVISRAVSSLMAQRPGAIEGAAAGVVQSDSELITEACKLAFAYQGPTLWRDLSPQENSYDNSTVISAYDPASTPVLQLACFIGEASLAESLLAGGANPNTANNDLGSAAYAAAINGHLNIICILANHGCEFKEPNTGYHGTAFQAANYGGHLDIMKLLAPRMDASCAGSFNDCLVDAARVELGSFEGDSEDLDYMFPPDWDPRRSCALALAASKGHTEVLQLLLEHYDIDLRDFVSDRYYAPLLHLATRGGHLEAVRYLIKREDIDLNAVDPLKIYQAILSGCVPVLQLLLSQPNIDLKERGGDFSPLEMAVHEFQPKMVECLLAQPTIDPNHCTGDVPPIHYPLIFDNSGSKKVLGLLLAHPSIDPNVRDGQGSTPLGRAALMFWGISTFPKACSILAHPRTDPNLYDNERQTPLLLLATSCGPFDKDKCDFMLRLLQHPKIKPPLYVAVTVGNERAVEALLQHPSIKVTITLLKVAKEPRIIELLTAHKTLLADRQVLKAEKVLGKARETAEKARKVAEKPEHDLEAAKENARKVKSVESTGGLGDGAGGAVDEKGEEKVEGGNLEPDEAIM